MLYVIYGNDREKGRQAFRALREKLAGHTAETRMVAEGEAADGFLDTAAASRGLFGETTLFVFDSVLEKKAEQELLLAHANVLASSLNHFLIFEPTLEKNIAAEIAAHATETKEHAAKKTDTRPAFNIFSLGDALGKRDKKSLWILYQQAVGAGLEPEEICGTLFWAVKNIALMKNAKPSDDAGLNPFVAKKSRGFAANYAEEEIVGLSRALATLYHEAHRGGEPMSVALEKFILSL